MEIQQMMEVNRRIEKLRGHMAQTAILLGHELNRASDILGPGAFDEWAERIGYDKESRDFLMQTAKKVGAEDVSEALFSGETR